MVSSEGLMGVGDESGKGGHGQLSKGFEIQRKSFRFWPFGRVSQTNALKNHRGGGVGGVVVIKCRF